MRGLHFMDLPWKALSPVDKCREYVALLSYLPLKNYRAIPAFVRFTAQIMKQLTGARGAIGYSLRAKPLSRHFWTLSIWEDEHALREFVRKVPHQDAMAKLSHSMGQTRFTRWNISGSAVPPNWDEAIQHARQEA
jgi:heme-degrading monooxygenase HmoA